MKDSTEERILKATLQLISERGYLGATTKEIARKAKVSEVTLFRHFSTKERLFEEVLNRYSFLPRLRNTLLDVDKISKGFEHVLYSVGMNFFKTLKERKSLVRIMTCEVNVYPEKIRMVYSRFIDQTVKLLAGYFDSLQKGGEIRKCPSEIASRAFLGMIFSFFNAEEIIKNRNVTDQEAGMVIKEFVRIFSGGIKMS